MQAPVSRIIVLVFGHIDQLIRTCQVAKQRQIRQIGEQGFSLINENVDVFNLNEF